MKTLFDAFCERFPKINELREQHKLLPTTEQKIEANAQAIEELMMLQLEGEQNV